MVGGARSYGLKAGLDLGALREPLARCFAADGWGGPSAPGATASSSSRWGSCCRRRCWPCPTSLFGPPRGPWCRLAVRWPAWRCRGSAPSQHDREAMAEAYGDIAELQALLGLPICAGDRARRARPGDGAARAGLGGHGGGNAGRRSRGDGYRASWGPDQPLRRGRQSAAQFPGGGRPGPRPAGRRWRLCSRKRLGGPRWPGRRSARRAALLAFVVLRELRRPFRGWHARWRRRCLRRRSWRLSCCSCRTRRGYAAASAPARQRPCRDSEVHAVVARSALGRRRPRAMVTAVPASASSPAAACALPAGGRGRFRPGWFPTPADPRGPRSCSSAAASASLSLDGRAPPPRPRASPG